MSRARVFCAACEPLTTPARSVGSRGRERGPGVSGGFAPWRGSGQRPDRPPPAGGAVSPAPRSAPAGTFLIPSRLHLYPAVLHPYRGAAISVLPRLGFHRRRYALLPSALFDELLALCLLGSGNSVKRVLPSQCRRRPAQLALDTPRLPRPRSHPNSAMRRIHPHSFHPYATAAWAWLCRSGSYTSPVAHK